MPTWTGEEEWAKVTYFRLVLDGEPAVVYTGQRPELVNLELFDQKDGKWQHQRRRGRRTEPRAQHHSLVPLS